MLSIWFKSSGVGNIIWEMIVVLKCCETPNLPCMRISSFNVDHVAWLTTAYNSYQIVCLSQKIPTKIIEVCDHQVQKV